MLPSLWKALNSAVILRSKFCFGELKLPARIRRTLERRQDPKLPIIMLAGTRG